MNGIIMSVDGICLNTYGILISVYGIRLNVVGIFSNMDEAILLYGLCLIVYWAIFGVFGLCLNMHRILLNVGWICRKMYETFHAARNFIIIFKSLTCVGEKSETLPHFVSLTKTNYIKYDYEVYTSLKFLDAYLKICSFMFYNKIINFKYSLYDKMIIHSTFSKTKISTRKVYTNYNMKRKIIFIYIIGRVMASQEEDNGGHDYAVFEVQHDPNALQREMSRLLINAAAEGAEGGEQVVRKSEDQVEKDMCVYWRCQSTVNKECGPISADCAFVTRNLPYTIRSLIQGSMEEGWKKIVVETRKGGESSSFKIFMPPNRPLYVLCGASHVENLAKISYSHSAAKDIRFNANRTAFVIFKKGTAEWFLNWGNLVLAHLTTELKVNYPSLNPSTYYPILLLMSPFTWNLTHKEETFTTHDNTRITIPWAKTAARNLMKASEIITQHAAGNPVINWGLGWMDCPVMPKLQVRSCRLNKLVREVNYLIDPNLPICRSWRVVMTANRGGYSPQMEVSGMSHLHMELGMYGKGEGEDNAHLSDLGSAMFLKSIYTGWGQGLRDRNAILDFPQCRPAIAVPPYLGTSYFHEVQDLRQQVADDTSDVETLMALNVLDSYTVDVNSINFTIRYQAKHEFLSSARNSNQLVQRTRDRVRKTEAYYKKKRQDDDRKSGAGGRGGRRR
jgi:hypothetical protein